MSRFDSKLLRTLCTGGACLLGVGLLLTVSKAEVAVSQPAAVCGNVDFDFPDAPPASMELDVSQGMFHDLFGIGEAAVAGVVEGLAHSTAANADDDEAKATAEGLAAAQQVVQLIGKFVQGARFNGYELSSDKAEDAKKIDSYYTKKLRAQNWQTIFRMRDGDETYAVSALRSDGAIKGLFVFACDGDDVYLLNLVCDISPDNVKNLTTAAAQMGLKVSASQSLIEDSMHKFKINFQSSGE